MESSRRKVLDRDEADFLLAEWRCSGEELAAFARARGVDGRSFHCWRLNLERPSRLRGSSPALRLVELAVSRPRAQTRYRLEVGSVTVEVDDGFQEETLARLLQVVMSC